MSELYDFLKNLEDNSVEYVSWKNNHELGDALDGKKDLDIFVPYKYKNRFYKCASKSFWIKLRNHVADFPDVSHFYKFTSENKTFHIHVYFKLITGESWIKEFDLPLEDFFLMNMERCKTYKIWKLNNDAQSYIFFIRHFLKNGSFFSRALYKNEILSYKDEWDFCNLSLDKIKDLGPYDLSNFISKSGLNDRFRRPSFSASFAFRKIFYKYLRIQKRYLLPHRIISFYKRLVNKIIFKKKKYISNNGLVIAIAGSDGSGKSSIIENLEKDFASFLNCKKYSIGKPQGAFLEKLRLLFNSNNKDKTRKINSNTSLKKALLSLILAFMRLSLSKRANHYARNGHLIIADRWPTNEFGKMDSAKIIANSNANPLIKFISNMEKRIYKKMPTADLCIFLNVKSETVVIRNENRVKEGKETRDEILDRYYENKDVRPIANKIIEFDNNTDLDNAIYKLKNIISAEIVNNQAYEK